MVKLVTQFDNFKTETRLATPTCCGASCSCCCCSCFVTAVASGIVTARYFTVRTRPPKGSGLMPPAAPDSATLSEAAWQSPPDAPYPAAPPEAAWQPPTVAPPPPAQEGKNSRRVLIVLGALLGVFTGITALCIAVFANTGLEPAVVLFSILSLFYFAGLFPLAKKHRVLLPAVIFTIATGILLIVELYIWLWGLGLT